MPEKLSLPEYWDAAARVQDAYLHPMKHDVSVLHVEDRAALLSMMARGFQDLADNARLEQSYD